MPPSLEDLEKRLVAVEAEVAALKSLVAGLLAGTCQPQNAALPTKWLQWMEEKGIRGEPVGVEKLREMMLAEGIRPEDNIGSREIIKMREAGLP